MDEQSAENDVPDHDALVALADELAAFDCLEMADDVPLFIDVPDDYEAGLHEAARRLHAVLTPRVIPPASSAQPDEDGGAE